MTRAGSDPCDLAPTARPGRARFVRRIALGATMVGLIATLTAPPTSAATTAAVTLTSSSSNTFQLTDTDYTAATANLYSTYLTNHATLGDVITTDITTDSSGDADTWLSLRTMRNCATSIEASALPPVTTSIAKCWSHAQSDDTTSAWYPQGLSTTGTADGGDGAIQGKHVIAVSWHYVNSDTSVTGCAANNVVKVTLLDRDTMKYRHVLLVEPTSTSSSAANFKPVTGHGGGIAWYANYLYVTDTGNGIRVFDINKLAKVSTYGKGLTTYGVSGSSTSACGYAYVLPEVHKYFQAGSPSCGTSGPVSSSALCFGWLSLDKTTGESGVYRLVTGEWYGSVTGARVVRYKLNTASATSSPGLLTTSTNSSGAAVTAAAQVYTTSGYLGLQGGMTWTDATGVVNFAFHKGCGTQPGVFSHVVLGQSTSTTTCADGGNWAAGPPQALSYWPKLDTTQVDELWGLTEGICTPDNGLSSPDVCAGYSGTGNASVRGVFAVGFNDSAVMNRT